jgi:hypothetical protein
MRLHATVSKDGGKLRTRCHPSRSVAQVCDAPQDEVGIRVWARQKNQSRSRVSAGPALLNATRRQETWKLRQWTAALRACIGSTTTLVPTLTRL